MPLSNKRKSYLNKRDSLYMDLELPLKDIVTTVAHNAATNSKKTTSTFVNQVHSVSELLEAGFGLEIDLHNDNGEITVCHSTTKGCQYPLLDRTPFRDVVAEIINFKESNPDRLVFIDFEDQIGRNGISLEANKEAAAICTELLGTKFKDNLVFRDFLTSSLSAKKQDELRLSFPKIAELHEKNISSQTMPAAIRKSIDEHYLGFNEYLEEAEKYTDYPITFDTPSEISGMGRSILSNIMYKYRGELIKQNHQNPEVEVQNWKIKSNRLEKALSFFANLPDLLYEKENDNIHNATISRDQRVILSSENYARMRWQTFFENEFFKQAIDQLYAMRKGEKENAVTIPGKIFKNGYHQDGVEMGKSMKVDEKICDYFQNLGDRGGLPTSYDQALGFPISSTYTEETIDKLMRCGVKIFKFDYVIAGKDECDARLLQIDKYNLEQLLKRNDLNVKTRATCLELLEENTELSQNARYPFPKNSAFLAPLIGKPLAQLETVFAAAKYYSGIDNQPYEEMIKSSEGKYKFHNPFWSFASSAGMGAAREISERLGDYGQLGRQVSYGLKAALTTTDLYLYSQSPIPLGMSMLVATVAEKSGCTPSMVSALKYGSSVLTSYALDPGATVTDTLINSGISFLGAAAGTQAVRFVDQALKRNFKKDEDSKENDEEDIEKPSKYPVASRTNIRKLVKPKDLQLDS